MRASLSEAEKTIVRRFILENANKTSDRSAGILAYGIKPTNRAFSASHASLVAAHVGEWLVAAFVPDYSGGSAVDSHHLPRVRHASDADDRDIFTCQLLAVAKDNLP